MPPDYVTYEMQTETSETCIEEPTVSKTEDGASNQEHKRQHAGFLWRLQVVRREFHPPGSKWNFNLANFLKKVIFFVCYTHFTV